MSIKSPSKAITIEHMTRHFRRMQKVFLTYFAIFGELVSLFRRCQAFPRATERQLNTKGGCGQNVDFPGFNFLKITGGDFSAFSQIVLRQPFADAFPAHIRAENLDSLPFFFGNCHDTLHRFPVPIMNDTYIVN